MMIEINIWFSLCLLQNKHVHIGFLSVHVTSCAMFVDTGNHVPPQPSASCIPHIFCLWFQSMSLCQCIHNLHPLFLTPLFPSLLSSPSLLKVCLNVGSDWYLWICLLKHFTIGLLHCSWNSQHSVWKDYISLISIVCFLALFSVFIIHIH